MLDRNRFFAAARNRKVEIITRALLVAKPASGGSSQTGQSLVEFALLLPVLLLLLLIAVDFGGFIYSWIGVANAARAAANYEILGGASIGLPRPPSASSLSNLINADLASLPNTNSTNPTVSICQNNNGTTTAITGTCSSPPVDPEATSYTSVTVDISYTYTPLIARFGFPGAGFGIPVIPTSVHRRTVMRLMQ